MLTTIRGIYRNGHIELIELPDDIQEETLVLVTFLPVSMVNLRERGISREQAADLRARLTTFAEDWDSPEMDVYDDYDHHKDRIQTG